MLEYQWNFPVVFNYLDAWLNGIKVTLFLSANVICFGTIIACLLVLGVKSRIRILSFLSRCYIDFFRAMPALVLLGTLYFCLPIFTGIILTAYNTALLAFTLNLAPFAAECIRAGIESIPNIQYDSAKSVGFQGWKLTYYVIGPQAYRRILPPLVGQYITTVKLTSLAATIGVAEIWHVTAQIVPETALPLETRLIGALLYVSILLPCLWSASWLERKLEVKGLGKLSK